jgi:CheY-like chemotaxis protein
MPITSTTERRFFRILIIEDDRERERILKSWLPPDVRTVVAGSGGRAIGILERDRGRVYAGILLDHDLQGRIATSTDRSLDGKDIVNMIVKNISKDVPILVHSMNVTQAPVMAQRLEKDGYSVTRIPMANLTKERLQAWVEEARAMWEDE